MAPKPRAFARTAGLTIVEILCVIAIMASLSALLFPVLMQAKVSAQSVPCSQKLHQIGTAETLYLSDFDDRLPMATDPLALAYSNLADDPNAKSASTNVMTVLASYGATASIFTCPLDHGGKFFGVSFPYPISSKWGSSYYFPYENEGRSIGKLADSGGCLARDYGFDWHLQKLSEYQDGYGYCVTASTSVMKIWD